MISPAFRRSGWPDDDRKISFLANRAKPEKKARRKVWKVYWDWKKH